MKSSSTRRFPCPHCAAFHNESLPDIKSRFIDTGQVRLVFRDFPLDQPALTGSMLAHCQPDKHFFPVLDQLFAHQTKWAYAEAPKDVLRRYSFSLVSARTMWMRCFADTEANRARLNRILNTRMDGQNRMDVDSTPTFFRQRVEGRRTIRRRYARGTDRIGSIGSGSIRSRRMDQISTTRPAPAAID